MKQGMVYDLPTRFFHWIFAALFLTAFVIGKTVDDDSPTYAYHMLAGLLLGFTVLLRIVWGVVGTSHARFSGFALNPLDLLNYFKGILSGDKRRWAGHNPASSWAAIIMMILALSLGVTGYLMTSPGGSKKAFKEIHELLANGFLVVVILHVAGVILHTIRHQEMIGLSMIDGKKNDVAFDQTLKSSRGGVAILFLGLLVVFAVHLFKNYNAQAQTLNLFGTTLQLGENEGEEEREGLQGAQFDRGSESEHESEEDED